ncbi:hypothetical protein VNO77_21518 [Canavalia gladiata]|uniref:Uncharacterized protein n=1 Tax=Canavalia gladiata TaxID=3824 RepID=A0AAN9QKC8_CANGL
MSVNLLKVETSHEIIRDAKSDELWLQLQPHLEVSELSLMLHHRIMSKAKFSYDWMSIKMEPLFTYGLE